MARVSGTLTAAIVTPEDMPEPVAMRLARAALSGAMRVFSIVPMPALWEVLARSGTLTPFQLPAFSTVVEHIWSDGVSGDLWINTGLTLYRALTAFCIASIGGVAIGMADWLSLSICRACSMISHVLAACAASCFFIASDGRRIQNSGIRRAAIYIIPRLICSTVRPRASRCAFKRSRFSWKDCCAFA